METQAGVSNSEQAAWFLRHLFADELDEGLAISIWSMPGKETRWFTDTDEAAAFGVGLAENSDVYFGCAVYRTDINRGRGTANDVRRITSLWADVDYGPGHKKEVPPDIESAGKVIRGTGIPPSIIVHSGHGLHGYWLLKESEGPDRARDWLRRWNQTLQAVARVDGWEVDSTHDLARVLRLPGTLNHKQTPPVPVRLEPRMGEPGRYDIVDLIDVMISDSFAPGSKDTVRVGFLELSVDRRMDPAMLRDAVDLDRRFKHTWERTRQDMKDSSASAYDLALAHFGESVGWDDQRIADLIIEWRVRHREAPEKALRQKYMQDTIGRAKRSRASETAIDELQCTEPSDGQMDSLRSSLGIRIKRWVQHGVDQEVYNLILDDGTTIEIAGAERVTNLTAFSNRIYAATGHTLPLVKKERWMGVCRALAAVREVVPNPSTTRKGQAEEWIGSYLLANPASIDERVEVAATNGTPFWEDGWLYLWFTNLKRHVGMVLDERSAQPGLWPVLRADGWEPYTRKIGGSRKGARRTNRRFWRKRAESPFGTTKVATPTEAEADTDPL